MNKFALNHGGGASRSLKAFTLAEVLITLAIIGVVAALTIPSVVTNYKKNEIETKTKSALSILSNSLYLAVADHGPILTWDFGFANTGSSAQNFAEKYIIPYTKTAKICGTSTSSDCIYDIYQLNGEKFDYGFFNNEDFARFYLVNGTAITLSVVGGMTGSNASQIMLFIDTNGWKKPNKLGVDVQVLMFNKPSGINKKSNYRFSFMGTGSPEGNISDNKFGCKHTTTHGSGVYCTSLITVYNGWKIPTKQQYVDWGGAPEEYPWNF